MLIEQTLHGYSEGHRLLATSKDFPRDSRHIVLGLSDLSGRSIVTGFEEYLTAYPVPGTSYYAFAKTWYAAEMERPGCVWTHTLYIKNKELGQLRHLLSLCRLFERPRDAQCISSYEVPISFDPACDDGPVLGQPITASILLTSLYERPGVPVLVPANSARELEPLFLEVWSQQWPALRSRFRFTTGAIAPRVVAGTIFDLQVVPEETIREVRRIVPSATVAEMVPELAWRGGEWLTAAVPDLDGFGEYRFRSFLRQFSQDLHGREAFALLAEFFLFAPHLAEGRSSLRQLVETVGEHYPEPQQGVYLKQALFGWPTPLAPRFVSDGADEENLLFALSTTPCSKAFMLRELSLLERSRRFQSDDHTGSVRLVGNLVRTNLNGFGEELVFALADSITPDEAARLLDSVPEIAVIVARRNPEAAALPTFWQGPPERQWSIFDAATSLKDMSVDHQRELVFAMLEARSDAVADRVLKRFGDAGAAAVLDWFDGTALSSPEELPTRWRRALANYSTTALEWIASRHLPREATVALVADLLSPHSPDVHRYGATLWIKPHKQSRLDERAKVDFHAFLLALGFDNVGKGSDELVVRSFDTVHEALAHNRLKYDTWNWFEDELPVLQWFRNWDRCERLRQGLINRFVAHSWPIAQFVRCGAHEDLLYELLVSCQKAEGGELLLHRIKMSINDPEFPFDDKTRRTLKKHT